MAYFKPPVFISICRLLLPTQNSRMAHFSDELALIAGIPSKLF
jgi:hypothetical protein